MSNIGVVESPAAWRATDMGSSNHWKRRFEPGEIAEIDAGLRHAQKSAAALGALTTEQFPLPGFSSVLAELRGHLETGAGVFLYKGFPVEQYSVDELRLIYWGLAVHLGTPVTQSKFGDLLGDVRDMGVDEKSHAGRGYTSSGTLSFHSDAADVTGLFCLQVAKQGGGSMLASSVAVHNEIAQTRARPPGCALRAFPLELARPEQADRVRDLHPTGLRRSGRKFCQPIIALEHQLFISGRRRAAPDGRPDRSARLPGNRRPETRIPFRDDVRARRYSVRQ